MLRDVIFYNDDKTQEIQVSICFKLLKFTGYSGVYKEIQVLSQERIIPEKGV